MKFDFRNPDFNETLWPSVEAKLGRKLLPVENQGLFQTSGMFKEWFFQNLDSWSNEYVERLIDHRADYVYGWANRPDKPERKGQTRPGKNNPQQSAPEKRNLLQRLFDLVFK